MSAPRSLQDTIELSNVASFSVNNDAENDTHKRIRFYYDAPAPTGKMDGSEKFLLVNFYDEQDPPGELELRYSPSDKKWIVDFDMSVQGRLNFLVTTGVDLKDTDPPVSA
jgi:hypothetical protein